MVKKFKFTKGPMAFVKNWKFRNYFFKKKSEQEVFSDVVLVKQPL